MVSQKVLKLPTPQLLFLMTTTFGKCIIKSQTTSPVAMKENANTKSWDTTKEKDICKSHFCPEPQIIHPLHIHFNPNAKSMKFMCLSRADHKSPVGHPWPTRGPSMGHPWATHGPPMGHHWPATVPQPPLANGDSRETRGDR